MNWRPYFHNDWVPPEGMTREDYLVTKFGSSERYNANAERVAATAAEEGLNYDFANIKRQPNTTDCHRLIRWANGIGKAAEMKQRLMNLYFTEGADLSDRAVLVQAAADIGLDADDVRAALENGTDRDAVEREANSAKEAGIEGVPCFIFGGRYAVSGAQSPEYLASMIERVASEPDAPAAE